MLMDVLDAENLHGYPDVQALRAPPALIAPWQPPETPPAPVHDPLSVTHGSSPCPEIP